MHLIKQGWAWTYLFKMIKTNVINKQNLDVIEDQDLTGGHSQHILWQKLNSFTSLSL